MSLLLCKSTISGKPDAKLRSPLELKGFKANGAAADWGKPLFLRPKWIKAYANLKTSAEIPSACQKALA